MEKNNLFNFSIDEISNYDLEVVEEKVLYLRYLIRRETQEYKLIKYQHYLEHLERRKNLLKQEMPASEITKQATETED